MQCGPIRYTAARPDSAPHDLEVVPRSRFAKFDLPPDAGIQDVFHHLATDHERTRAVAADVGDAFSQGRKVLVLTERTEHLDAIRSALWRGAYRAPVQRSSIPIRARVRAGKPVPDALLLPYLSQSTPGFRKIQTVSGQSADDNPVVSIAACFPLPWSHYARLLTVRNLNGREFYEAEALRGGWTIRQLNRQIESQFYERTVLSKDKSNMLRRGSAHLPADVVTPEDEIKDPYFLVFLEFLALKDEYSETDLESALIMKLETFLLELGGDFTFVGRQRRLRVGDAWYRVDLLFFHRRLRCLIIVDLKLGKFTHADAGQMHLYVNYARKHWAFPGESPPVGLILRRKRRCRSEVRA